MTEQMNVLVVDDNADLRDTFAMILQRRGFKVATAGDGAAAVDTYQAGSFDVTLMDIVMPNMNGVEALKRIRKIDPQATVILMTAYSDDELIRNALAEGVHRVVNKPVRIEQIVEMINNTRLQQPVLIVDDDPDILDTLSKALEKEGHRVLPAASGEEAIRLVEQHNCSIAFIDIKLPNIDGLETYLRIKAIRPDIVGVLMTGFRNEVSAALERAQANAAIDCLYKPFPPDQAVALLKQLKRQR